ncbi:MAG TPA: hypothetical protein VLL48_02275, partial [Longimicrobiales bacterium]|nr:hypothetical protein [Longimicrobiales bacterium]
PRRVGGGAEPPGPQCTAPGLAEGRLMRGRLSPPSLVALAFALFLASLSLVTWRQSRALEALETLEEVHRSSSLAEADRAELVRRIQFLESRGRVVSEARSRLGMHIPDDSERVFLAGGSP